MKQSWSTNHRKCGSDADSWEGHFRDLQRLQLRLYSKATFGTMEADKMSHYGSGWKAPSGVVGLAVNVRAVDPLGSITPIANSSQVF